MYILLRRRTILYHFDLFVLKFEIDHQSSQPYCKSIKYSQAEQARSGSKLVAMG